MQISVDINKDGHFSIKCPNPSWRFYKDEFTIGFNVQNKKYLTGYIVTNKDKSILEIHVRGIMNTAFIDEGTGVCFDYIDQYVDTKYIVNVSKEYKHLLDYDYEEDSMYKVSTEKITILT